MKSLLRTKLIGMFFVLATFAGHMHVAMADGNETLGPPSIPIAEGSGVVANGTGMVVQPGLIELDVPGTVVQALLYWEGFGDSGFGADADNEIVINGSIPVTGTLIGGPSFFFYDGGVSSNAYSSTYRADITGLGLIQSGFNSISLSDLSFGYATNGAGLMVIYEDGSTTEIAFRDGNDVAYGGFPASESRHTTVPQTFTFAASAQDRNASMTMFFSSVEGVLSGDGPIRPTVIEINTGGQTTYFDDLLMSNNGDEWDTLFVEFLIPAGATSLTIQARSEDRLILEGAPNPASFVWNAAALNIETLQVCSGRIGDYVWYDGNAETSNNIQDGNDMGIPNVTVNLLDAAMSVIATTTTDGNGFYEFTADDTGAPLCAGEYFVDVVDATLPMGYSPVSPFGGGNPAANDANDSNGPLDGGAAPVSLPTDSSEDVTIDFGYLSACSGEIGDYLWYDGNAVERNDSQDADDTGIDGITVWLRNSAGDIVATTTSGPNGFYKFSGLCAGDYTVEVDEAGLPMGYMPVTQNVGGPADDSNGSPASVNLPADDSSELTIDFGYYSDCSGLIGDFVWHDLNRDGIQDPGEPGIDGVRVVLTNSNNDQVAETTSGPNGAYEFGGLCADDYTVTIDPATVPDGFTPTLTGEGTVETDSSDSPVSVPLPMDDSVDETIDFGYITPCEGVIGDYVWEDTDRNGIQGDPLDEPGFVNYPVVLKDAVTLEVLQSTTTDEFGFYQFMGLCAGEYIVEVATPSGYEPTQMVGGMPALDSNGSPATVTLPADDATDVTIDFGFRELPDPSIDIRKQEEGPDSRTFVPGSNVPFEIVVKNTGNTTLIGVKVTDALALDCEQNPLDLDGTLSPGEEVSYFCNSLNVTSPFNNEACVDGIDEETEAPVNDCDTSEVDLIDIDIRKQAEGPDLRTFASGTDVTFEIEVTNTGSVDLAGVVVTDVLAPACDKNIGFLAAGDSTTYECTIPGLDASLDNEVCVTGTEDGGQLTTEDCDPSDVEIIDIDIRKQAEGADSRNFNVGDDVTFEIMVTNTGDETLMNVMVTDLLEPNCDKLIGTLTPGASDTYECTTTNLTAGYTNVAKVTGERNGVEVSDDDPSTVAISGINIRKQAEGPDSRTFIRGSDVTFEIMVTNTGETTLTDVEVTDAAVPGCGKFIGTLAAGASDTYMCTIVNTMGSFTNEACVEGTNGTPIPLEDCDPSDVEIIDIDIRKQAEGPDSRNFSAGDDVTFEIMVTNTGDETLMNVTVTDPLEPNCNKLIGTMLKGATDTYECTTSNLTAGYTNVAMVTGERGGVTVSDEDPSTVAIAGIDIRKQAEGPDSRTFIKGSDVTFEIMVTNTGETTLNNVMVTDIEVPGCAKNIGTLLAGASDTYECTIPNVLGSFTNEACVIGTNGTPTPLEDCDPSDVEIIDIDIRKQAEGADSRNFNSGDTVTFEIMVTNTGDETLMNVMVTDPLEPDCNKLIGTLTPGASDTYECTTTNLTAGYTNVAKVTGERGGVTVSDEDPSTVAISGINIRKQAEGPDSRTFIRGSDVTFEIMVTNTGETTLTDVEVTDAEVPGCGKVIGTLAAGASDTYMCTIVNTMGSFTNEACVEGTNGTPIPLEDCDPSDVEIIDIDIRKQAEGQDIRFVTSGSDVNFEIVVTNTGDEDLVNVTVTDALVPDCDKTIGPLAAGASSTYSCLASNVTDTFNNIAKVTGERNGVTVMDEDPSRVALIGIDIRKEAEGPDSRTFASGSAVPFQIVVTNTGDRKLFNVAVTDAEVPGCANNIGELAIGASVSYSCTASGVTDSFTNEACVSGTRAGVLVSDCDPSDVEIIDIDIRKQAEGADTRGFATGANVPFEIVVTNTGDEDLANVTVTDQQVPACGLSIGGLAAGDSFTYSCTAENVMAGFTNVAKVTGERNGVTVMDEDPSTVTLSSIDIRKQAEGPDSRTFAAGSDVSFEIVVTNTGEVTLTNVMVSDAQAPDCANDIGTLTPAQSVSYSCTSSDVSSSFTNEACVAGMAGGLTLEDCDPSDVEIIDIDIRKQIEGPDTQTVSPGDPVTWLIVVTNTGDEDLSDVMVTDVLAPACDMFIGNLAAGESQSYPCTLYEFDAGFTNEACVEGSRNGVTVGDCDPSTVIVPDPCGLTVDKLCFVTPPPPSSGFACTKPIDSLTMIWTGSGTVTVKAWKGPVGSTLLGTKTVGENEEVTFTGFAGSPNDVFWEVFDGSGNKLGESKFHLSCSDDDMDGPEDCGLLQGNGKDNNGGFINLWQLEGMVDRHDTLDCTVDMDPVFAQDCEFVSQPGASCETEDKPKSLTFRYTPSDCSTTNDQDGNYECDGGTLSGDATFALTDDEDKYTYVPADGMLQPGDLITITSDDNDFESNFRFELVGNTTQTYEIHTSCSKDLAVGDVFGSFELVGFNGKTAGQEVQYAYQVFNNGPGTVTNVVVDDDKLGEIGSGFQLEADTGMTLYAQAFIEATTTNTVTVTGFNASTLACLAQDSVTVIALEPPTSCATDGKPTALEFTLGSGLCSDFTNTQNGKAKCVGGGTLDDIDSVTMSKDANKFAINIVGDTFSIAYDDPAGDKMPSTIKFRVKDSDGTTHDHELHTSCSQPLAEGDVFGGLVLTNFVPEF